MFSYRVRGGRLMVRREGEKWVDVWAIYPKERERAYADWEGFLSKLAAAEVGDAATPVLVEGAVLECRVRPGSEYLTGSDWYLTLEGAVQSEVRRLDKVLLAAQRDVEAAAVWAGGDHRPVVRGARGA